MHNVNSVAGERISEEEGNYSLIPSSTNVAQAETVELEHAGAVCLCM
jgi:hypothetical protein